MGVTARPGGPSLEIQEGVADGVLIAAVRVLPVEHRLVTVDADALFAVRENAESAQGRAGQVTDHAVKDAFLQVRSGFSCKIEHVAHDGAQAHLAAWLEEVVRRAGGDAPAIRNHKQAWVSADEQGATSGALRVLPR